MMTDQPRRGDTSGSDNDSSLRRRLAKSWAAGRSHEFSSLAIDELGPKIRGYLLREYSDLSAEDCEDCFCTSLERFYERDDRTTITNPESYIWTSTKHKAVDLLEERQRLPVAPDVVADEHSDENEPSAEMALILAEALMDEVEADPSWATAVVALAVSRLRPALQRVVRHLLVHGPGYEAASAPDDLGLPASTFRANKSKAFSKLRALIPAAMEEQGITPPSARVAEVFREHYEFAADVTNGGTEPDSE